MTVGHLLQARSALDETFPWSEEPLEIPTNMWRKLQVDALLRIVEVAFMANPETPIPLN